VFLVIQRNNPMIIEELHKLFSHSQKIFKMIKIYNSQTNLKFKARLLVELEI
jgi:hypothetical protein